MNALKPNIAEAFIHVLYEMEMLHGAAELVRVSPSPSTMHNVALESFVIHARALEEFFCKKAPKEPDDTMQPAHFVPGFGKQPSSTYNSRMHKEIAHLTYSRKRPGEKRGWTISEVVAQVGKWSLPFLESGSKADEVMKFDRNRERTLRQIEVFKAAIKEWDEQRPWAVKVTSGTTAPAESIYMNEGVSGVPGI